MIVKWRCGYMEIIQLVVEALKIVFPAYCANAIPVIAGGGRPIDLGKKFLDGKPIFGKNKTVRGFFAGLIVGSVVGFGESVLFNYPIFFGLTLSLGALSGDLIAAFIKRRLGFAPGALLPVIDQIDFVVGAILFFSLFSKRTLSWELIIIMLIITPPLHMSTNIAAYKMGLKSNPW